MNSVNPIRDPEKIEEMKKILRKQSYRNYFLFVAGINVGLRIGDLLPLKVGDVREKSHIVIREQKTGKEKRFRINENLQREVQEYVEELNDEDYLFPSRQGRKKPLTRVSAAKLSIKLSVLSFS